MTNQKHHASSGDRAGESLIAIDRLHSEFAHRLDRCDGRGVDALFEPDGSYIVDGSRLTGRDAIRNAYAARADAGPRTVRHIFTNRRIVHLDSAECTAQSVLILFGGDGHPVLPGTQPLLVADVEDVIVRSEGEWLFRSRSLRSIFRGEGDVRSPHSVVPDLGRA